MAKERIFITGGTGFFGKSLLRHCRELQEHDLVLLLHETDERDPMLAELCRRNNVSFLRGDVRDFPFPEGAFDRILHAATPSCRPVDDEELTCIIRDGTARVLELARRQPRLANFLYISSGAVYGPGQGQPLRESDPCQPQTPYGRAKLAAESLCHNSGLPCTIARGFAFVGEYLPLNAHFAIGNFIRDCLRNRPIVIRGDGTPIRSYLYAGDLARWLWVLLQQGVPGNTYNVGSDRRVSVGDLAGIVRAVMGATNEVRIRSEPSGEPAQCYVPDITSSCRLLDLEVNTSLEEAIRLTAEYHLTDSASPGGMS